MHPMCMKKLVFAFLLIALPAITQSDKPDKTNDHAKVMEGCVVRDGSDYYLRPLSGSGNLIHLSAAANQDFASLVGRRVRVHGSEQGPNASQAAEETQPVTPVEKQPPPSTVPSGTPDPNVQVTQLPQSAQAGQGTEGFRGNARARELFVSSLEPLAGSCKSSPDGQNTTRKR